MTTPHSDVLSSPSASTAPPSDVCIGPPPVLSIAPVKVNLPDAQRKKLLLMKRRLRLQQEATVRLKSKTTSSSVSSPSSSQSGSTSGSSSASRTTQRSSSSSDRVYLSSPLTGFEVHCLDDACLVRYLQARDWHVSKAFEMLMESLVFRREMKPERIRPRDVRNANKRGTIYRRSFDREGHPIIYMRPRYTDPTDDPDLSIRMLVYMVERALESMDKRPVTPRSTLLSGHSSNNVSSASSSKGRIKSGAVDSTTTRGLTFVIDYNGYTSAQQPPLHVTLRFIDIFQNYYPEALATAFIIDTPWYFQTFWNLICSFMPARTVSKLQFISSSSEGDRQKVFQHISPTALEDWFPGGKAKGEYDHKIYWEEESRQFESYMKFLQEEFVNKSKEQRDREIKALIRSAEDRGRTDKEKGAPTASHTLQDTSEEQTWKKSTDSAANDTPSTSEETTNTREDFDRECVITHSASSGETTKSETVTEEGKAQCQQGGAGGNLELNLEEDEEIEEEEEEGEDEEDEDDKKRKALREALVKEECRDTERDSKRE